VLRNRSSRAQVINPSDGMHHLFMPWAMRVDLALSPSRAPHHSELPLPRPN
jgi:hypothetical protein